MFTTHSSARIAVAAVAASALLGLASCGDDEPDICTIILDADRTGSSPKHVIVVEDTTATVTADRQSMPEALKDDLEQVSKDDGSVSVIAVDGEGVAPNLLAKRLPLSTDGERDRPSVERHAKRMPACVSTRYLDRTAPTAPGTDLGRAMATAAEMTDASTIVWMLTDFVWTSGDGALTADLLSTSPQEAAQASAQARPIDLAGAELNVVGVANTSTPLDPLHREWLRDYARELCVAWGATGCDSIELDPAKTEPASVDLPEDVVPPFPETEVLCTDEGREFEVPSALLFAGDSAVLRDAAAEALAEPIALLRAHPSATAEIVGHTASSTRYTAQELTDLSEARAKAVSQALQAAGIDASRLAAKGVGDTQPKAEDLDDNGMQNEFAAAERRVDVIVTGVEEPCSTTVG
ncbi:MAG TPA: OmpA family protein [Arachnia sp.]|nr:OmpA family protein [Arachnia sp.]HMT84924.1 OmpA family protein [Arachnia sp.]